MATEYIRRTYSESDRTKKAKEKLDTHAAAAPGEYLSPWASQLEALTGSILTRPAFQYDAAADPLYQQYRDNYVNLGRMAMMDTMGQAAALTGGYGSSYGQMAGQQAYTGYLQGLNNVIPELYQLAMDAYDRQNQQLYDQFGLLSSLDSRDYGRYMDGLGRWQSDRDYLTGRYDTERGFDYTGFRDTVGDDQWQAAFDEDIRRFDFANKLGEFAVTEAPAGGGGGGGYGGTVKKKKDEEKEGPNRITTPGQSAQSKTYLPQITVPYYNDPRYNHVSY